MGKMYGKTVTKPLEIDTIINERRDDFGTYCIKL